MKLTYYKVLGDAGLIGVGTSEDLRKHQKKHNILVFATGEDAEYISVSDELYHAKWMNKPTTDFFKWQNATVAAIGQEEYETLKTAFENDEKISDAEDWLYSPDDEIEESPEVEDVEITADYVRSVKIRELSLACSKAITDGFDIKIDGQNMHFSMTANDQLNLQDAAVQILNGSSSVPYHPDGGEFMQFDSEIMLKIINAANDHKTYHLAYFNALKKWVNALKRISSIQSVEYGSDVPAKYQSAFLKSIFEG